MIVSTRGDAVAIALRGLHLRQHDAVQVRAGAGDDLDHVGVGPLGGPVVHPDHAELGAPAAFVQGGNDVLARVHLGDRRDRVLQVEEHLVRVESLRLGQEPRVRPGCRQTRPPTAQNLLRHHTPPPIRTAHPVSTYLDSSSRPGTRLPTGHGQRTAKPGAPPVTRLTPTPSVSRFTELHLDSPSPIWWVGPPNVGFAPLNLGRQPTISWVSQPNGGGSAGTNLCMAEVRGSV
jgi:hypothetical protein